MGNPYEEVFYAADINGDGQLEFNEIVRITRHLEPEYFKTNSLSLKEKFNFYLNPSYSQGDFMTMEGFKKFCMEENIYSRDSQQKFFSSCSRKGLVLTIENLLLMWGNVKEKLEKAFGVPSP